mgnify:CR=1 FL=1
MSHLKTIGFQYNKMDMLFEKQGAFVQESLARLRKVNSTYRGERRLDEFEKVLTALRER